MEPFVAFHVCLALTEEAIHRGNTVDEINFSLMENIKAGHVEERPPSSVLSAPSDLIDQAINRKLGFQSLRIEATKLVHVQPLIASMICSGTLGEGGRNCQEEIQGGRRQDICLGRCPSGDRSGVLSPSTGRPI